jgi:RsiW-degrading membrane proteinase PrsW (M82 family)
MGGFLLAVALSFGPAFGYAAIVYWLDRFEKEPKRLLLGAFLWGALVATIGAIVATTLLQGGVIALTGDELLAEISGTTIFAPLVEESLKGFAVLLIWLVFPQEFDSPLDGMVYGAITALGFAATENVLYLYFLGYADGGMAGLFSLFVLRVLLGAWGHAVYTAFIGIGLALARLSPHWSVRLLAPFVGWLIAVFLHALHNTMATVLVSEAGLSGLAATLLVDWTSWALVFGIVIWEIFRERGWMRRYLAEEVQRGTLSAEQYTTAGSIRRQLRARRKSRDANRFYNACAELAQKKHQLAHLGEERGNSAQVERLRQKLSQLSVVV